MKDPIIIVGAGASGIGMGVLLKRLGLPFLIIDQARVGASFTAWSEETRFISPSFSGNAFGAVDLNAVTPDTSPAFSLKSEHPKGKAYANYLWHLSEYFKLPIRNNTKINRVEHHSGGEYQYILYTDDEVFETNFLIWATGEFFYPNVSKLHGAEHCLHYQEVKSWADLEGDEFHIIGAYESGVDAAYHLINSGKKVTLFDGGHQLKQHSSDSSYTLSPFTRERYESIKDDLCVINEKVNFVKKTETGFDIQTSDKIIYSSSQPINCTGFEGGVSLVKDLFEFDEGHVQLNDYDESTICPNLFLVGPQVRHGDAIFCFIYKYRQRFGVVGEQLSQRMSGDPQRCEEMIEYYRSKNFYLDDLSCCDDECVC